MLSIGNISEKVPVVSLNTKSSEVDLIFEEQPSLEGIVVACDNKPLGLVMKAQFYKKISGKYGFDLFMGRPIELVMDSHPLLVDHFEPITKVSSKAMNRNQKNLYDYVVVTKESKLQGIVSIKNLLIKLAEEQVNQAMYTNPLSGLPGNVLIEEKIAEYLTNDEKPFSVLYIDLDHFKEYNDTYGFKKGDFLLKEVSNLLSKNILLNDYDNSFVGHIGGDDFVAILPHYHYQQTCQLIITEFEIRLKQYYNESDWINKYVYTKSRNGIYSNVPLVSLSIAVVTNQLNKFHSIEEISKITADVKAQCKEINGSCYISYKTTLNNECR
ncbi:GGDEF domain-containing protein [Metabacillus litoralis]|uniref:GGDEF domain-containing protein n=1 Tax=Metabacillus litoralis TaxID=152268 RepID=UPI001CFD3DF3|nr:GGDEF domain-containing protein [Metabacillus litoralis]